MTKVLLAGATGLVGRIVAPLLLQRRAELSTVGRGRSESFPAGAIHNIAEPRIWPELVWDAQPETAISCLGTTLKKAGSKEAFRAVDYDLVIMFAKAAKKAGAKQFISVSSVGASSKSGSFYLRTKGETEAALTDIGFERLDIMRPGLLTGATRTDSRAGESLAAALAPLTDLLMMGPLKPYRSTPATKLAQAVANLVARDGKGKFIHENDEINVLAG